MFIYLLFFYCIHKKYHGPLPKHTVATNIFTGMYSWLSLPMRCLDQHQGIFVLLEGLASNLKPSYAWKHNSQEQELNGNNLSHCRYDPDLANARKTIATHSGPYYQSRTKLRRQQNQPCRKLITHLLHLDFIEINAGYNNQKKIKGLRAALPNSSRLPLAGRTS